MSHAFSEIVGCWIQGIHPVPDRSRGPDLFREPRSS